jgi:hypothetical protein
MLAMIDRPATTAREPGAIKELLCKHRPCATLLASLRGDVLVLPDGTRVGAVRAGMTLVRRCPRCKAHNVFWF